jgi:hypothetical protein
MFDRLILDPQARADAKAGLAEMGRGIVWLIKWAAIVAAVLAGLAVLILLVLISNEWTKAHADSIRWAVLGGAGGYALWLLLEIRKLLVRTVHLLERFGEAP